MSPTSMKTCQEAPARLSVARAARHAHTSPSFGSRWPRCSENHPLPSEVSIGQVEHLALGYFHACVALSEGGVSCFGSNGWSELGNDDLGSEPEPSPVTAVGIEDTRRWGRNDEGQFGDGTTRDSDEPTFVLWE